MYTERVKGGGNVLWNKLQEERQQMLTEEAEEENRKWIARHTRMCPNCDSEQFIEDDDYMCYRCRIAGD